MLYPFEGVIQHYAWGGHSYLPQLLHRDNPDREPWAELWMGAHAKGPAQLRNTDQTLDELIARQPRETLGEDVARRFDDRLPFLLKILDVREMLSIQVHPTKEAAEAGFAREERDGPARDAPDRNYRDDNHKPELGVALTDFYLLHGFRDQAEIERSLQEIPGWAELLPVLSNKGTEGLYAHVMAADTATVDRLLSPLVADLQERQYTRDRPRFWAKRAVEQYTKDGHHDRGMFSIFWFNLVKLSPGQGIFQDAGIPHAYLEGVCIELMANSDNVLRGGLTPKHIDVPELMDKTRFEPVQPHLLSPVDTGKSWAYYPTPAPDFRLWVARTTSGESLEIDTTGGAAILLLMEGELRGQSSVSEEARTVFIPAGCQTTFTAAKDSVTYLATVN
ncbi:mannose-6-phosphate isomerase, class I [Lewinella sp. JB7]|uniref:mannose-6-phosphate isomerase, class I n=1 Tax=Lewinella sp. JB7 TaxID=2962887 RepID=UPI0020C97CF6|nr:mannose-6-phosphate isomerase, class I [Lewinella sp. JB7]MCP9237335.1 mannose-6-phosphate isomerase, class I [Lewinella sp. JB7]